MIDEKGVFLFHLCGINGKSGGFMEEKNDEFHRFLSVI